MKTVLGFGALLVLVCSLSSCRDEPSVAPVVMPLALSVDTIGSGTTVDLYGVSFPTADTGYVVGSEGVILKTTDGGSSWTSIVTPTNGNAFSALKATLLWSAAEGIVGGGSFGIYRTQNGGATWDSAYTPGWPGTLIPWNASGFVRLNTGELLASGNSWAGGPELKIYRSGDSGLTWEIAFNLSDDASAYSKASQINGFRSFGSAYAVCTSYERLLYSSLSEVFTSSDPDSIWTLAYSSFRNFYGIEFLSSGYLMTVGDSGWVNRSADGGSTWTLDSTGAKGALRGIATSSLGRVLVVGDSTILTGSGSPWALSTLGSTFGPLTAVTFASPTHAIAVGKGGRIYSFRW